MYENLQEKVKYEYDRYFQYLRLISRPNFYDKSFEIASKKALYEALINDCKNNKLDSDIKDILMNQEDVIDYIWMRHKDLVVISKEKITDDSWSLIKAALKF